MKTFSDDRPQAVTNRIARGIGVAAISTVLVVGLAGCMTGRTTTTAPAVVDRNAHVPAGIDIHRPADRIAEQLAKRVYVPSWTDRIDAQLEYEAQHDSSDVSDPAAGTNPYAGMTADHIERLLTQAK